MLVKIIWSQRDWADAVAQLPVEGVLPCRTVLIPRADIAHVARRELIRSGQQHALAGTRFISPRIVAIEVLREAGLEFEAGEETFRETRLATLELREGLNRRERQFTAAELREREKSSWLRDRKEYEFYPSGNFVFTILEYCGQGVRKVWSDGKRQRAENCLNSIIAGLGTAAEGIKALRLRREQRERERQEEQGDAGKKKSGGGKRKKRSNIWKIWSPIGIKAEGSENFCPSVT